MNLAELLLIAIALGTDAFSAAVGIGMGGVRTRYLMILSGTVLAFHVFMPLIGVVLGGVLGALVGSYAAWIGAGVLILIGLLMVRESLNPEEEVLEFGSACKKPVRLFKAGRAPQGWGLVVLGGSLSLDALSVGFSLGTLSVERLPVTVGTIGVVAGLMTAIGLIFGRYLGRWIGHRATLIGGIILVLVGIRMGW